MLISCRNVISQVPFGEYEMSNPKTIRKILHKLPFAQQEGWRRKVDKILEQQNRSVTFEDLVDFIEQEARALSNRLFGRHLFHNEEKQLNRNKGTERCNAVIGQVSSRSNQLGHNKCQVSCWYCQETHFLNECERLREEPYGDRVIFVRNKGLCFSCLRSGHRSKDYSQKRRCGIRGDMLVTVLHKDNKDSNNANGQSVDSGDRQELVSKQEQGLGVPENSTQDAVYNCTSMTNNLTPGCDVRMCIMPVKIRAENGISTETYTFIDNGSSGSFITEELLGKLAITNYSGRSLYSVSVSTLIGNDTIKSNLVSGLSVSNLEEEEHVLLSPLYGIPNIPVSENDIVRGRDLEQWDHLKGVNIPECNSTPGLLIGINVPKAMEPFEVIHSPNDNSPFAVRTRLGWCIYSSTSKYDRGLRVYRISVSNIELEKMLSKLYNNESGDLNTGRKGLSIEDKQRLETVENGCCRVEGGRYEIPLPVSPDIEKFPETKPYAVNRLNSLSGKLKRNKVYYAHYCDFMKGLLDKGCVEVAQDADKSDKVWYLPHFGVYHPNKPDKIRVVHDCATRVQMMSLNDTLLQGPDLMYCLDLV